MITWAEIAPEVECAILMVAGTNTTGCYMGIEMEITISLSLSSSQYVGHAVAQGANIVLKCRPTRALCHLRC